MHARAQVESKYDWRRIEKFLKDKNVRDIFPEIIDAEGFDEQQFTFLASKGTNQKLKTAKSILFTTGPCILSAADVKPAVDIAKKRIEGKIPDKEFLEKQREILARQPTLQNLLSIGIALNNSSNANVDVLCKMETLEVAMLLAGNDKELYEKHKNELLSMSVDAAKRTQLMIERLRAIKGVNSKLTYFYTHAEKENKLLHDILDFFVQSEIRPRIGSFFKPTDWRKISKTRIETMYTKNFTEAVRGYLRKEYDMVIVCENLKFFKQVFDGSFILPLEQFDAAGANWIGIVPPPALTTEREMDASQPLYLGGNVEKQLDVPELERFSLGVYLMSLVSKKELEKFEGVLDVLYSQKPEGPKKDQAIAEAKSFVVKRLREIVGE